MSTGYGTVDSIRNCYGVYPAVPTTINPPLTEPVRESFTLALNWDGGGGNAGQVSVLLTTQADGVRSAILTMEIQTAPPGDNARCLTAADSRLAGLVPYTIFYSGVLVDCTVLTPLPLYTYMGFFTAAGIFGADVNGSTYANPHATSIWSVTITR
jgi:hypothetical protein